MCEKNVGILHSSISIPTFNALPNAGGEWSDCCHRLGDSVHDWSTLKGGRKKIGIDNYVYMLWRYNDCCVRYIPN
nr:hypothetical protein [Escherichia coli]